MNDKLLKSIEHAEELIMKLECDGKPISEVVMMLTSAIALIIVSNGDNITLQEKVRRCSEQLKEITRFINEINKDIT